MSFAKSEDCFITLSIESGNTNSNGVKKDEFKARQCYEIFAQSGDPHAKHNLAKGVKLDIDAAKQGALLAQYNLGLFFYEGTYFKQDYIKSRKSFEFAAAQN